MTDQPKPTAALSLRTAAQLSNQWALYQGRVTGETDLSRFHAEFDRWLAEHDAQVLRATADHLSGYDWAGYEHAAEDALNARARRIEAGGPT